MCEQLDLYPQCTLNPLHFAKLNLDNQASMIKRHLCSGYWIVRLASVSVGILGSFLPARPSLWGSLWLSSVPPSLSPPPPSFPLSGAFFPWCQHGRRFVHDRSPWLAARHVLPHRWRHLPPLAVPHIVPVFHCILIICWAWSCTELIKGRKLTNQHAQIHFCRNI